MDNYNNGAAPRRTMGPVEAVKTCFSKYVTFSGRASRAEFWWWCLFTVIISWVINLFGPQVDVMEYAQGDSFDFFQIIADHSGFYTFASLVSLALFLPSLAVSCRRLHDIGCSGWWLLLYLTCIGGIALLIMYILASQPYPNKYGNVPGTDPKGYPDQKY